MDLIDDEDPTRVIPLEQDFLRQPSEMPSMSLSPTVSPSQIPSLYPSYEPTEHPTDLSSQLPSSYPSYEPSNYPTTSEPTTSQPTPLSSVLPSLRQPSEMPSMSLSPTVSPSQIPSLYPSYEPTEHPTDLSSQLPSSYPSYKPSNYPTTLEPTTSQPTPLSSVLPSNIPSNSPTPERPDNYFNYNPTSPYGPPHWDDVRDGEEFFDEYVSASSRECGDSRNSPINLEWKDQCVDDHHVHTERGYSDWKTNTFEVLPHALRVVFSNRNGPRADFSNLSKFVRAFYLDVKLPSEHTMEGKQFMGEVHIGHRWDESNKGINIGFFLDPVSDVFNPRFEMLIREWEEVAWERRHNCQYRSEINYPQYVRTHPILSQIEAERVWIRHDDRSGDADWDLYQLQPTLWYYGYRGGYTVPPCTENVHWRFLDFPAHISWKQYNRMKALIVDQLDNDCNQASIAHNGGINRPVQDFSGEVYRCKGWKVKYKEDWTNYWPEWYHAMKTDKLLDD